MGPVVLINPNTNATTTTMMTDLARTCLHAHGLDVVGRTVTEGPSMITDPSLLPAAARQVVEIGIQAVKEMPDTPGIIVSAFADPGLDDLAAAVPVPVTGIAGAAIRDAARDGRRFGIASVAPALTGAVTDLVHHYGHADGFTGMRTVDLTAEAVSADPDALTHAMITLAEQCVEIDGAEVVIIGGGPLGAVAEIIRTKLSITIVVPITAACAEIAAINAAESTITAL